MTDTVYRLLPCDPAVEQASALGHCGCWTFGDACCFCQYNPPRDLPDDELAECEGR